ncbi:MAG: helix-turn-helix domain-containing protein [Rhodospirillales bacterium]|nr:helix-turn-helix domain-containing protein [Rhodospirillales bacterium]
MKHYVVRHCADPDLTPKVVAGHFRMSVRYLHKLFARSGTKFGRFVLRCRLRCVAGSGMLGLPCLSILNARCWISAFQGASHFTRCFRREFGMTPGAMRRLIWFALTHRTTPSCDGLPPGGRAASAATASWP